MKNQEPRFEDPGLEVDRELARRIGEGDRVGLGPYARGTASVPMRLWLLKIAGERLGDEQILPGTGDQGSGTGPLADPVPTPASGYPRSPVPQLAGLREALGQLPRRQQAVMALALFEGMAAEGIAAASGRGLARSMRELRRELQRTGRPLGGLGAGGG